MAHPRNLEMEGGTSGGLGVPDGGARVLIRPNPEHVGLAAFPRRVCVNELLYKPLILKGRSL